MNWSARRISEIAKINNATRYLEIGVHDGATFVDVDIEYKDAVDPDFRFDTNAHASDKVRFFTQTSDAFWTSDSPLTYDVIMIDGLHTYEQTLRDLLASLRFAHARTVWLIDDTVPCDVFSALPDQGACYRERNRAGLSGWEWHGDVFKIVPAIHDFLPVLSYATLMNSGNPQTVAWYTPRTNFAPKFNDLEAISRLTFYDVEPNASLFNYADEGEAMARLRADFARG